MSRPVIASFPLSPDPDGNWAYLHFTRAMTQLEWGLFAALLDVMKDAIIEQPLPLGEEPPAETKDTHG